MGVAPDQVRIVRCKENGRSLSMEIVEDAYDIRGHPGIQVPCRLIGQEEGRIIDKGTGNGYPLPFPGRQGKNRIPFPFLQAHLIQDLQGLLPDPVRTVTSHLQRESHILTHRSVPKQSDILENHTDGSSQEVGSSEPGPRNMKTVDDHLSVRRSFRTKKDSEKSCLSRTA